MKRLKLYILLFLVIPTSLLAQPSIFTVGTTGADATSLQEAFAAINDWSITGDIVFQLIDNTTEPSSAILYESGHGSLSDYTSVTIYPTVTGVTISGDFNSAVIDLNGADNVTIDGRLHATDGSIINNSPDLTITNITAGVNASTIQFINSAKNNFIRYCNIKGSETSSSNGVIFFSTDGLGSGGNSNNTIDHNMITGYAAAGRPVNSIISIGTVSPNENCVNLITSNNIFDFLNPAVSSNGIFIGANSTTWTLSGNSFYETSPFTATSSVNYNCIRIDNTTGNGFSVTGNFIGGQSAACGGLAWTKSASNTIFCGISLNVDYNTVSTIQNNIIKNFIWANTGTADWTGVQVDLGAVNIGGIAAGNTIGEATSTESILVTGGNTNSNVYGINIKGGSTVNCSYNNIGSITAANVNGAYATNLIAINKTGTTGTTTISNNTIGSTSIAYSLSSSSNSTGNVQNVYGISHSGTMNATISGNTISNIVNNTTNSAGKITGIYFNGGTGTNSVKGNFIKLLSTANSSSNASVYGIRINKGVTTYSNNIITLDGNTQTTTYGFYETGTAGNNNNLYFNTIYIGGSVAAGTEKSYALYSAVPTNNRDLRNNVFVNERSTTGGSGLHYAVWFNYTSAVNLTLDYNDYYISGTGGVLGRYNNADVNTLPIISGKDGNSFPFSPGFANAGGPSASDYLPSYPSFAAVPGTGILTDYYGTSRSSSTPAFGALEYTVTTCTNPTNGGVIGSAQIGCASFDPVAFTSTSDPTGNSGTLEYKWKQSTTSSSTGFTDIPGANSSTYNPGSLTITTWFKRVARVTCKYNWNGAAESNVVEITVNTPPVAGGISGSNVVCMGSTLSLASAATGTPLLTYTWNSTNTGVASVDNFGIVTPVSAGTTDITYSVTDGSSTLCSTISPVLTVTVNAIPATNLTVGGTGTICTGTGTNISVVSSVAGVNYQLRNSAGNVNIGIPLAGTGGTIDLPTGNLTATTIFNVLAINIATTCSAVITETEVVTIDPASVGGTLSGGTTPIIYGSATGTISLSGQTGSVVKWQKIAGSGSWTDIANTAITYTETPNSAETWQYRSEIKSGVCPSVYSELLPIVVLPKALTITANNETKSYGTTYTFAGTEFTATGLINGNTVTSVSLSSAGSPSTASVTGSPYSITASSATGSGLNNYSILYSNGLLTITKAILTVTADAKSKTYRADNPPLTFRYAGWKNNEAETILTTKPSATTTVTVTSPVGIYSGAITVTGGDDENYDFTYVPADLTVTKANQTITFNALASKTFGDADFIPVATASSGLPVSISSSNNSIALYSNGMIHIIGAGTVVITASQAGNEEFFAAPSVQQTLQVFKSTQTITFSDFPIELLVGDSYTLIATSTSGLPITYGSSDELFATIDRNEVTGVSRGTVQIRAYNDGGNNFIAAETIINTEIVSTHKDIMYLFTPNGDGFNDYWELPDLEVWGKCDVKVYNRWGMLVFADADYQGLWDGTSGGSAVPEGAYFFIIKTENSGNIKGTVNVVR